MILVTTNSEAEAYTIAQKLLENKEAACVSIMPKVRSLYIWEDQVREDEEFLLFIKTRSDLFEKVRDTIKTVHSYSIPEIISLPITHGLEEYISWIKNVTAQ